MSLNWFEIAKELKNISQAGKFFAKNDYELKRHLRIELLAAKILAEHTGTAEEKVLSMLQEDCGYPTPKVDCRGVVFRDDKILLVKEIADGGWTLPGGWCDVGLTPAQNVVREIYEESGFEAKVIKLLAVFDRDNQGHTPAYPFSIYKLFFHCEITGGSAAASSETSAVEFFAEDAIPSLSFSSGRTLPGQIKRFFEHYRNPALPAEFD